MGPADRCKVNRTMKAKKGAVIHLVVDLLTVACLLHLHTRASGYRADC